MFLKAALIAILTTAISTQATTLITRAENAGCFQINAFNIYAGYSKINATFYSPYSVVGFHVQDPTTSQQADAECLAEGGNIDAVISPVPFGIQCLGEPINPLDGVKFGLEKDSDGWFLRVTRTYTGSGMYNGTVITDSSMVFLVEDATVVPGGEGEDVPRIQVPPGLNVTEYLNCSAWFDIPYARVIHLQ